MNQLRPATYQKCIVGMLILTLCLMPLLDLHIHLPETHMGAALHSHHAETHGFHLHASQHDNIDVEIEHQSDTKQINLDVDTRLVKVFKFLTLISLAIIFLNSFNAISSLIRLNYINPFQNPFEIFRALLRGPPAV